MELLGEKRKVNAITKALKADVLMPYSLKSFAIARIGKKPFKNLNSLDQEIHALDIVTVAHASCGDKGETKELLEFQKNELLQALKGKHGELTVDEIKAALEMLIAGEAGAFFGLNRKSYYQALKFYQELPQRVDCMKEHLKLLEPKPKTLNEQEKKEIIINGILASFDKYKETKALTLIPRMYDIYYGTLKKLDLIEIGEQERGEIKSDAVSEQKRLNSQEPDITTGIFGTFTYDQVCKKLALEYIFDSLLTQGKELKDMIG